MNSLIHLKLEILKSKISMSSSREKIWTKKRNFGSNEPFKSKTQKYFFPNNSTPSSFQWGDKLITCKKIRKLQWVVPGKKLQKRTNRRRVFNSTFTLWVQKTMKLSKLMSLFPLHKSRHKLTFSHHYKRRFTKIGPFSRQIYASNVKYWSKLDWKTPPKQNS